MSVSSINCANAGPVIGRASRDLLRESAISRSGAFADFIDSLTTAIGRAVAWLALAIVLVQFSLVVARYAFGLGSIWLTELVTYGSAMMFMLAAAWTLRADGHVRVDVFYAHAQQRAQAIVDLIGALLLLLPFAFVLIYLSVPYASRSWAIMERSHETSGLPLVYVLKTVIPLFAALMALQGIAQAIRAAAVLFPAVGKRRRRRPGRR